MFEPLVAAWNPFSWLLDPIVHLLSGVLGSIDNVTHNIGWSLVLLAALIGLALWPLRHKQFNSAVAMQRIAPELKALQAKYKGDPTKLNEMTMQLYKERGVNPFASCFPLLLQMPILLSVYWAITSDKARFNDGNFLWIGTPLSHALPFLAKTLVDPDYLLLALYVVSMFFSLKLTPPPADPAAAQQQKMMAYMSPVMIGGFGLFNKWPSALIVYWLSSNLFTMGQQFVAMKTRQAAEPSRLAALATPPVVDAAPVKSGRRRVRTTGAALAPSTKVVSAGAGAGASGTANGGGVKNGAAAKSGSPSGGSSKNGTNAAAKRRR